MRALVAIALAACGSHAQPTQTIANRTEPTGPQFGTIAGVVIDKATHEPIAGVTAVANPAAPGREPGNDISRENGHYGISGLPPGHYTLSLYYADFTIEFDDVDVRAGEAAVADWAFDQKAAGGDVVKVPWHR